VKTGAAEDVEDAVVVNPTTLLAPLVSITAPAFTKIEVLDCITTVPAVGAGGIIFTDTAQFSVTAADVPPPLTEKTVFKIVGVVDEVAEQLIDADELMVIGPAEFKVNTPPGVPAGTVMCGLVLDNRKVAKVALVA
jgi:hypothetical protein